MGDYCERFLKKHRSEIIQKTREPIALADRLRENNCISDELYNKIQTQKHKDQMREIYKCLNSRTHFVCVYNWLKERESNVLEDMETRDAEAEAKAPLNKRPRDETHPTVDETDNISTELPDLKMISTFAKLETWVSDNSQKLISDLKEKLGESGLEALKKELKNRGSKNSLCFNASNIKDIKGNKELEDFLSKNNTKIPKLTFSMFFKKNYFASSGEKNGNTTDNDEPMDTTKSNISNTDFNEKKDNNTKRKTSTTRGVKDETGECSRRNTDSASGTSVMGGRKENKLKKKTHMNKLLRDWASRQCDGSKEGIKNVFDQISIINMAEHRKYPCFTAENVRVYKNPKTCESQIIFIADEKMPKTSVNTMTHYHMFVCDLQKTILLGPKDNNEQEIKYEEGFIRIDKCKRFIFEVFAPTLAVFKKIQEEELNSLI